MEKVTEKVANRGWQYAGRDTYDCINSFFKERTIKTERFFHSYGIYNCCLFDLYETLYDLKDFLYSKSFKYR